MTADAEMGLPKHGTYARYQRHIKYEEGHPCDACLEASKAYVREYRSRDGVKARERRAIRRRARAASLLVSRHRDEYLAILAELKDQERGPL